MGCFTLFQAQGFGVELLMHRTSVASAFSTSFFLDTTVQVSRSMEILCSGKFGPELSTMLSNATNGVRTLYRTFKHTTSRIIGSPQSFGALRSRSIAVWHAFGPWTMAININPAELNCPLVFKMAGVDYPLNVNGTPSGLWQGACGF